MQAILTRYLPATAHRPPRIKATARAGSLTIDHPDHEEREDNHRVAASALADQLGWSQHGTMHGGTLPDGSMAWVFDR